MTKVRRGRSDGPTAMGSAQMDPSLNRSGKRMNEDARNADALRVLAAWMADEPQRPLLVLKLYREHRTAYAIAIVLRLIEQKPIQGHRPRVT